MQLHDVSNTLRLGPELKHAQGAVILLHGRGSSAKDITKLGDAIGATDAALLAPQARNHHWYPRRFLEPIALNEPWLTSALATIDALVNEALAVGIPTERIAIAGFSQGGCLSLEYAARNPRRYAFIASISGALMGPTDIARECGDLLRTPVLVGCAESDAHIPLENVEHSTVALDALNADVTKLIFPGAAHHVFPAEIEWLKKQMAGLRNTA